MKKFSKMTDAELAAYKKDQKETATTEKLFGGKYGRISLLSLEHKNKCFKELHHGILTPAGKKMSTKTLTKVLDRHKENGFLITVQSPTSREQEDYQVTDHGKSAIAAIREKNKFAVIHDEFMNGEKQQLIP